MSKAGTSRKRRPAVNTLRAASARSPSKPLRIVKVYLPTYCPVQTRAVMREMTETGCEHRRPLAALVAVMRDLHDANKEDIPRLRGMFAEIRALSDQLCPLAYQVWSMWPQHISDEELDAFLAPHLFN